MAKALVITILVLVVSVCLYFAIFSDDFVPTSIRGKRVLITGSSAGIGEQLAYQYSKLGAQVMVTARREKRLQEVVKKCLELGAQKAVYVVADLAKPEERTKTIHQAEIQLGGLDHLILNHVEYTTDLWVGSEANVASLRRSFDGHFFSYVDLASKSMKLLTVSRGNLGIVNSIAGKFIFCKSIAYSSNKFALNGFFSALRQELAQRDTGISVTSCILGPIATHYDRNKGDTYLMILPGCVKETAMAIIKGVSTRQNDIYHPLSSYIAVWLHFFFPTYIEAYTCHSLISVFKYFNM